ncbi:uncharacterized protein K452DRAFT_229461 [Aplosporella prunicola CBS 121167]|uniref:Rhodopsin domain-containing protein n=1 Tax=Aplosporella prunicola CBS 121167 TaxID=1176127 RepID=A0A6A6BBX1_9PEZI|nr:uncharacterized protein K452DRAFT_229461 [Aplosporella prunicola CBS 121167]KAF2141108.1 hypothetical protein K452DRAFT_229461 [Aplosporella prunicola CBS 121167]
MSANNVTIIPAPYKITPDDKRGLVVVVTTTTLAFIGVCLLIRLYTRLRVQEWKRDDWLLALATLFCGFQAAAVYVQVHNGLGARDTKRANFRKIGTANFVQLTLYIFTLFLSKAVVVLLYLRLSPSRIHALASKITLGASAIWMVFSETLISIRCNPLDSWTQSPEACALSIATRWNVVGALDIATEVSLFGIAILIVSRLHMALRLKALVILAFGLRLPVIIAAAARLHYIDVLGTARTVGDASINAAYVTVCSQFQLDFAIMASTIACLGPFLRPFDNEPNTSYHHASAHQHPHPRYSHRDDGGIEDGDAICLQRLQKGLAEGYHDHGLRPDFYERSAGVVRAADGDAVSVESCGSTKMIIKKKMVVRIEHDTISSSS